MEIAFKEWALVCEALAEGRQTLLLRKGGIAEGRQGFSFKHERFYLFPTFYHGQREMVRGAGDVPEPIEGEVRIDLFAEAVWSGMVTERETLAQLEPFHVLKPEVIEQRFSYDEPAGVNVALARVFRLGEPWIFKDKPAYGGCRSWVGIPDPPPAIERTPALDDDVFDKVRREVTEILFHASPAV